MTYPLLNYPEPSLMISIPNVEALLKELEAIPKPNLQLLSLIGRAKAQLSKLQSIANTAKDQPSP